MVRYGVETLGFRQTRVRDGPTPKLVILAEPLVSCVRRTTSVTDKGIREDSVLRFGRSIVLYIGANHVGVRILL